MADTASPPLVCLPSMDAALRWVLFRAEGRPGTWCEALTAERRIRVRWLITAADGDAGTAELHQVEVGRRGRLPNIGDRYALRQALVHMGWDVGAEEEVPGECVFRAQIVRTSAENLVPGGEG